MEAPNLEEDIKTALAKWRATPPPQEIDWAMREQQEKQVVDEVRRIAETQYKKIIDDLGDRFTPSVSWAAKPDRKGWGLLEFGEQIASEPGKMSIFALAKVNVEKKVYLRVRGLYDVSMSKKGADVSDDILRVMDAEEGAQMEARVAAVESEEVGEVLRHCLQQLGFQDRSDKCREIFENSVASYHQKYGPLEPEDYRKLARFAEYEVSDGENPA